jgi:hypothetical protein
MNNLLIMDTRQMESNRENTYSSTAVFLGFGKSFSARVFLFSFELQPARTSLSSSVLSATGEDSSVSVSVVTDKAGCLALRL